MHEINEIFFDFFYFITDCNRYRLVVVPNFVYNITYYGHICLKTDYDIV